jgi:hypothetical protein
MAQEKAKAHIYVTSARPRRRRGGNTKATGAPAKTKRSSAKQGAHHRAQAAARTVEITVVAQDPDIKRRDDGRVLTSKVTVPAEFLLPGPRSHRFFVVDYDLSSETAQPPAVLDDQGQFVDNFDRTANDDYLADPEFHAQNVYGIAARTLSLFEFYLGRRVGWAFGSHELYLIPHAVLEGNANYANERHGVLFGYLPRPDKPTVFTCLSHDIVAHEVTHAILDGLRPRYVEPSLPDQPAFHEAFADLVALLSVFEMPEVLHHQLEEHVGSDRVAASSVSAEKLGETCLFAIAEQLGRALSGERAVRYTGSVKEGDDWRSDPAFQRPHRLGEVFVGAVMRTLKFMWANRLEPLIQGGSGHQSLDLDRTVEEGATAANYLLGMLIRALDYMPPVELEFEDVLDSIIRSDEVVSPDDPFDYRGALLESFAKFGIDLPEVAIIDYADPDTPNPVYTNINFESLRCDPEEVYRFIWNNADLLNIDLDHHLIVGRVRTATRVGPDGLVVNEVVADYTQMLALTAGELGQVRAKNVGVGETRARLVAPPGLARDTKIQLWGGGALIFDQFAKLRFHQRKGLAWDNHDIGRQQRRLDYLVGNEIVDTGGRFGFSDGAQRGQRFSLLHIAEDLPEERW